MLQEIKYFTVFKNGEAYRDFDSEKKAKKIMKTLSGFLSLISFSSDGSERIVCQKTSKK